MSACEKCWADAGGSMERYMELLKEREDHPCTPDQQSGADYDGAPYCPYGHPTKSSCDCGPIAENE